MKRPADLPDNTKVNSRAAPDRNRSQPSSISKNSKVTPPGSPAHAGKKNDLTPPSDSAVLSELERFRTELLANISQELLTPLTSIKGIASTLARTDTKWTEQERQELLKSIDQETDRLNRIISGLTGGARFESGTLKLNKEDCRISDLLDSLTDQLSRLTRHHHLLLLVPRRLPPVRIDRKLIGQVILTLVQNAAQYSREGSPIIIEIKHIRKQIVMNVIDRGVGIPARLANKVFDRFYQIDNIVKGRQIWSDNNLSNCREIIEAHGCNIWVESRVGSGSTFSFTLPLAPKEADPAPN
jgi:two-component system sensor histidine kinase KdpD